MNLFDRSGAAAAPTTQIFPSVDALDLPPDVAPSQPRTDGQHRGTDAPASLSFLLGTGGDRRIWPDAVFRRNRYGTQTAPADDEFSFASTTASTISRDGFLAAGAALRRLIDITSPSPLASDVWFAHIRDRIARDLGCKGAPVILTASGTDAELVALCLFAAASARPLTNVLVAPDETGSGVPRAAAGRHYADIAALGSPVEAGAPLEGLPAERIEVLPVAIRDPTGAPRRQGEIDAEIVAAVERELRRDRDVIVHVLDSSKTGLAAVTREAARQVARLAPGRVRIIVDACQFRGATSRLRQDLADGFVVALTGSKFIAGPPFSGALLIPPALAGELAAGRALPAGLARYSAAQDWPPDLRNRMILPLAADLNLGLGLRWVAALAHLDRLTDIDEARQYLIKERFVGLVRARIDATPGISLHDDDTGDHLKASAVVPLTVADGTGGPASFAQCQAIQLALRSHEDGPVCHIGQAVHLGVRSVLRMAASARDVIEVAERLDEGLTLSQAFGPTVERLDTCFDKLSAVLRHPRAV